MFKRVLISFVAIFIGTGVSGQRISVVDKNRIPVYQAVLTVQGLEDNSIVHLLTDASGNALLPASIECPCAISIMHVSFETYTDTVASKKNTQSIELISKDIELNTITITSEYAPRSADRIAIPVRVITAEEIGSRASVSLSDVLQQEPGIRVTEDNLLGSGMSMNGLDSRNIKFLVDGVPVIGRLDGNIDINQLLLTNVSRVEIVNGPMSAMYGTDASGGVINIITKPVRPGRSAGLNLYHEGAGHYNIDGFAGGGSSKSSFRVSGGRNYFSGWSGQDFGRTNEWKPKEQLFGDLNYSYRESDHSVSFRSSIFHETISNKGEPRITPYYAYAFDEYYKTTRFTNQVSGSYHLNPSSSANISVSRSDYKRTKSTWRKDMVSMEEQLSGDGSMNDTTLMKAWNVRTVYGSGNEQGRLISQAGVDINIETAEGDRIGDGKEQIGDYALFASAEYKASSKFTFRPSLRLSYNSNYKAPPVPSIAVLYKAGGSIDIRFSYGRGFRAPGIKELYLYFVDVNHNIQGNRDLLPEHSDNFYLSVKQMNGASSLGLNNELGLFYNSMRNLITLAQPELTNTMYTYINLGKYASHGINLRSGISPGGFNISAGISVTGRYNIYADSGEFSTYIYNPDATLNAGYKWKKAGADVNVFYSFNGKLPAYRITEDDEIKQFYNDSYHLLDLVFRKSLFDERLIIGAGIKNLLDVQNISAFTGSGAHTSETSTMPVGTGRSYFFNLKFRISVP